MRGLFQGGGRGGALGGILIHKFGRKGTLATGEEQFIFSAGRKAAGWRVWKKRL